MMEDLPDGDKEFETFGGDIDKMLRFFETDKQTSYSVLWDVPTYDGNSPTESPSTNEPTGTQLVNQSKRTDRGGLIINDSMDDLHMSTVSQMVQEDRNSRSIPSDKNLFIATAWTIQSNFLLNVYIYIIFVAVQVYMLT